MRFNFQANIRSALKKLGGWYIPAIILAVQLTAFLSGAIGIYFAQRNAELNSTQWSAAVLFVMLGLVIISFILASGGYLFHRQLVEALNTYSKGGAQASDSEFQARVWRQANSLPSNFFLATMGLVSTALVAPLLLYMYYVQAVTTEQLLYILLAGAGATIAGTMLASLLLEEFMPPIRELVIPVDFEGQRRGFRKAQLFIKLLAVSFSVILLGIMLIAPIGYHHTVQASQGGGDPQSTLFSFQIESWVASFFTLGLGILLSILIVRSLTSSTRRMIDTFQQIEQGDLNQRLPATTADEIGELAVHFNHMLERLATLQGSLEEEVRERTAQLRATVQVANAISAILNTDELIERVVNLIADEFDYYYVALFLIDPTNKWAELSAATGDAGRVLRANRHRLEIGGKSMVGRAINTREPTVALDTAEAPYRFENPLLPYTRSEIALPLMVGDRVLGALDAQSTREAEFGPDDIEALRTMANQVAVALENARLFQDAQQTLQDMRTLQRQYLATSWKGFTEEQGTFDYSIGDSDPEEDLSEIDVPLMLRDQLIGEISVASNEDWTPEERSMIEAIANQASLALENARLVEESRASARREHLIAEITGKIWASTTVDSILQTAAKEIGQAFETDEVTIELKAEENE